MVKAARGSGEQGVAAPDGGAAEAQAACGAAQAWEALAQEVRHAAFYPELVLQTLELVLAGEPLRASLVQSETTVVDAVHRHLTALALTATRLVVVHVDDVPRDDGRLGAVATSEAVPVSRIGSVSLSRGVIQPDQAGGQLAEMTIAAAWGAVRRLDLEPSGCSDPQCQADHGLSGVSVPDDIVVRVAAGVEGVEALAKAEAFARHLARATAQAAGARL